MNTLDEIAKLKALLDDGAITQDEYDREKEKILAASDGGGDADAGPAPGQGQSGGQQYQHGGASQGAPYGTAHVPGTPYANYQEDVYANKIFAVISYIGFLGIITAIAAPKESHFARFHANQGIALFIVEIVGSIILQIAFAAAGTWSVITLGGGLGLTIGFGLLSWAFGILMVILAVLGIVNSVRGDQKPLPVTGGIRILK
jgi:uncharacterized membrane protein